MKKKFNYLSISLVFAVLSFLTMSFLSAGNPDDVVGTWLTGSGKGKVQIYKEGSQYFGKIVWLKEPNDPKSGQPKVDKSNPEARKKSHPLLGLVNLSNFRYAGDNVWEDGKVYDPENGKEYSCKMTLRGDKLDVRGYIGFSLLGRTDTWQRVK